MNTKTLAGIGLSTLLVSACSGKDGGAYEEDAIIDVKDIVATEIANLEAAATAIQAAAPDTAWGENDDAAIDSMKGSWADARTAYERVEGAIAVLFPDLDASTDERYDGFIAEGADDNLFDGEGVTGVHGIERILWADAHSDTVVAFESGLPNYTQAAWPATDDEAAEFKSGLVQRLIDDAATMGADFEPLALDAAAAYEGVVGSMAEQVEKIALAESGEAESRYAGNTLQDMRDNLQGGREIYGAFSDWVKSEDGGEDIDAAIQADFDLIQAKYDEYTGAALPAVGSDDYNDILELLETESDPDNADSLVSHMVEAAALIGIEVAL